MSSVVDDVIDIFTPTGKVKDRLKEVAPNIQSSFREQTETQRRETQQREVIDFQKQQAEQAMAFLEETREQNRVRLAELAAEKERIAEERRVAEEADAAAEASAAEKLKSRGRRRLALIKSGETGEGTLGNVSVGRRKILGN